MENSVGIGPGQELGLGDWHPARRPDTNDISDMRPGVPDGPAPEDASKEYPSVQDSLSSSESPAPTESDSRSAPEEDLFQKTTSDEPRGPREVPTASKSNHSTVTRKIESAHTEQIDTVSTQPSSSSLEHETARGFIDHQDLPDSITLAENISERAPVTHREDVNAPPPGLSWNDQTPSESRLEESELSLSERPGFNPYNRTNSFPDVPPPPQSSLPAHSLPHSQAENIMEENELDDPSPIADQGYDNAPYDEDQIGRSTKASFPDHRDNASSQTFPDAAAANGDHTLLLADDGARFEEGLPLMHPSFTEDDMAQEGYRGRNFEVDSSDPAEDAGDGFFSRTPHSVADGEAIFRPQALDRKTTSQVLDSMQYPPHDQIHDQQQPFGGGQSLADLTGRGISVPSSTVKSHPLSEKDHKDEGSSHGDEDLAAIWQAALEDDELLDKDGTDDPAILFEDDGVGFLDDEPVNVETQPAVSPRLSADYSPKVPVQGFSDTDLSEPPAANRYTPSPWSEPQDLFPSDYVSGQPRTSMNQQPRQAINGLSNSVSAPASTGHQPLYRDAPVQRPNIPSSTQSFADKAKGGYTSPYDLPMDVTRPKKRNVTQQLRPGSSNSALANRPSAPPRSSSMFASGTPVLEPHPPLPSLSKPTKATQLHLTSNGASSTLSTKASVGSFFEELPSVKPRPSVGASRVHAQNPPLNHLSQSPPLPLPIEQATGPQRPSTSSSSSSSGHGLVPPVRIGPYASVSHQVPNGPNLQHVNSKYSPAPISQSSIPPSRTRYAASPAGSVRAPTPASLPFQPRTSSPLAQSNVRAEGLKEAVYSEATVDTGSNTMKRESARQLSNPTGIAHVLHNSWSPIQASDSGPNQRATSDSSTPYNQVRLSHFSTPQSMTNHNGPTGSLSMPSEVPEAPESGRLPFSEPHIGLESQSAVSTAAELITPRRSQTQSPGAVASRPSLPISSWDTYQRPASVNDHAFPPQVIGSTKTGPTVTRPSRGLTQNIEYIRPTDGREKDALERWKGCPLFVFGFGGTIATTFPKKVQRYTAGHSTPLMKCSPGEIKIQARSNYALNDKISSFPGPLKSKGKKKDVLDWLQQRILQLEQVHAEVVPSAVLPGPSKRNEEKILLWRIMKVLVDFDGVVEGKPAAEQEIRLILSPELADGLPSNLPPSPKAELLSISRANRSTHVSDPTQPGDLEALRRILLHGQREQAVWHALDRRLWAHAMLISSTMNSSIWKQVLQEFIRQEVKLSGENTASLASLYQIFAGNWEESADELVPPSARAGLQFVSKAAGSGPVRNTLDGLDTWRETLTLALSNRTTDDSKALVALGRLLLGYGRVEAAHICFIFAKVPGIYGGADDLQASVTLLGADHTQHPSDFSRDLDCILITEVYEFASTVLALSPTITISPHLQAYKLYHAMLLAEYGSRKDAQEYCTAITNAMKSTTKPSPYHHSLLFSALDDLITRLRQAPSAAAAASWMSKPSLDKVSGSFLSRVNQFIAGDESDADSVASGRGTDPAAGPFAGIAGDTPNISRSPSSSGIYNTYPSGAPLSSSIASTSRYAPGAPYAAQGQYTPRSSLEQSNGNSQDSRHPSHNDTLRPQFSDVSRPSSSGNLYQKAPQQSLKSSYQPTSQPSTHPLRHGSYPTPPSNPEYVPVAPPENLSPSLYDQEPYRPMPAPEHPLYQSPDQAPVDEQLSSRQETGLFPDQSSASMLAPNQTPYQPLSSGYESASIQGQSSSYEPPSASHYEPPSYNSYAPDTQVDDSSPIEERPKKKSFMDNDDDEFEARAAATLREGKAQNDRETDEAFRKAAEADAQKGSELKPKKSGWLGGWFGGTKKDGDLSSTQAAPNAPIRAKLGEESSFVYDKELKKWINKKAGSETHTAAAATPPPPKGPPSRAVSASGAPTINKDTAIPPVPPLPSASSTVTPPVSLTGPSRAAQTLVQGPYSSTPVSRSESPVTMQDQSDGPSLRGVVGITGSNGPPSAPPSRPATGMSNASSIDDLIGAPQARKGGTIKKGKKGRGYIDVMANK